MSVPRTLRDSLCRLAPGEVSGGSLGAAAAMNRLCDAGPQGLLSMVPRCAICAFPRPWFSIVTKMVLERQIKGVYN